MAVRYVGAVAGLPASVLFVTWPGGGNTTPLLAIGQQLVDAGTPVHVSGHPSQADEMEAAGFGFSARPDDNFWDPATTATLVTQACISVQPELAIVDYMSPAALCATEALGIHTVALVHTLFGAMDAGGFPGSMFMLGPPQTVNPVREQSGLGPIESFAELLAATAGVLVTCPRELDTNHSAVPDNVRYGVTGLPERSAASWQPPSSERPLVVAGMGTTDMDERDLLARTIEAIGALDVDGLVTVGDHLDPASFDAPDNVVVSPFVDHAQVLPHADLVVSHGGLGTLLAAMTHRLSTLVMPIDRDQPANAEAIERVVAGRAIDVASEPSAIAEAITQMLADDESRRGAARMSEVLAAAPRAIDLIADWNSGANRD